MNRIVRSKAAAWAALLLIILLIVVTFRLRQAWWAFADIFFVFMMAFCHLTAVYLAKANPYASRKLDLTALVFAVLMIIALIVEFILYQIAIP